jgi:hypothetical protein
VRAWGYVVAMALAAGTWGCGGGEDGERSARQTPEPELEVSILSHDLHPEGPPTLILGDSFTLRGAASGGRGANEVELLASPYPHRSWRRVATRSAKDLTFRLSPGINTRYRLRLARHPRIRSESLTIYVDLRGRLTASLPAPGITEVSYLGRAGLPVTPGEGRVHFYLREDNRGPLRRVVAARPRQADARSIAVTTRYRDPDPRDGDRFVSCAVGLLAKGYGHPSPAEPECGNRVMAATRRRMNAPG